MKLSSTFSLLLVTLTASRTNYFFCIHCRLVTGTVQTVGDLWDMVNVYFHDLQYEANDDTKTVVYSRLWSLPIGGPGKYSPTFMGQIPATWDFNRVATEGQK